LERQNLWAPWRIPYIRGLEKKSTCFICDALAHPESDRDNFVLWRLGNTITIFNRFPYNNGHLLIAPTRHFGRLDDATSRELLEVMETVREAQRALDIAIRPQGFNIGINLGRGAGAGLPDHLHVHLVPRWEGDTNYMTVCADVKVISQSMEELYDLLQKVSGEHGLPDVKGRI
jgi:ATP adenylyltransferase